MDNLDLIIKKEKENNGHNNIISKEIGWIMKNQNMEKFIIMMVQFTRDLLKLINILGLVKL